MPNLSMISEYHTYENANSQPPVSRLSLLWFSPEFLRLGEVFVRLVQVAFLLVDPAAGRIRLSVCRRKPDGFGGGPLGLVEFPYPW